MNTVWFHYHWKMLSLWILIILIIIILWILNATFVTFAIVFMIKNIHFICNAYRTIYTIRIYCMLDLIIRKFSDLSLIFCLREIRILISTLWWSWILVCTCIFLKFISVLISFSWPATFLSFRTTRSTRKTIHRS